MPDAVHCVNGGQREPNAFFLFFQVEFLCESVPRRDTQVMTHESFHPESEDFSDDETRLAGDQVWKRTYSQSNKVTIGDSIGTLRGPGGAKRAEV
jgi:hypothetical protein